MSVQYVEDTSLAIILQKGDRRGTGISAATHYKPMPHRPQFMVNTPKHLKKSRHLRLDSNDAYSSLVLVAALG